MRRVWLRFMMVTVTPAVALDPEVYPATWQGKAFVVLAIVTGVLFLAMPLSTCAQSRVRSHAYCSKSLLGAC